MSTAIVLSGLTKRFGSGAASTTAVDAVSLRIEPGELFFLLGPSGCGKTTLLRMIAGFIEPTAGTIVFGTGAGERDVTFLPANKRRTGMVFQSYALWPHMTVEANVAFGLGVRRVGGQERRRRVTEALESVRMGAYAQRKPNQLSGGQQQRVALARALVVRPDVLLLDEPLSNLDARLRIELRSEIRKICKESGITTVYVTHDQKEALSMADRIAIVRDGRIAQMGGPAELYRRPRSRFVAEFLGETNFIEGVVEGAGAGKGVVVRTGAGVLRGAGPGPEGVGAGGRVVCSVRPEGWRLDGGGDSAGLRGVLVETTYLGETAQHVVDLEGGVRVRVAEMNPSGERLRERGPLVLVAQPQDVVLLPVVDQ